MLKRVAKPTFVVACICNAAFAFFGGLTNEAQDLASFVLPVLGGGLAFVVAAALGFVILSQHSGMHRNWIKAALVFLVLGPLAFWGLQWPAAVDTVCIARDCYSPRALAYQARLLGDVAQSHMVMIAVALAALLCATRATTVTLDELAA